MPNGLGRFRKMKIERVTKSLKNGLLEQNYDMCMLIANS